MAHHTIKSSANKSFIIDAAANPPKVGSNVSIWTTKNQNNQKWVIEPSTNGSYIIRNAANPSLVLDAAGVSPKCGANVSVWSAKSQNNNNQKWKIVTVNAPSFDADKTYEIFSLFLTQASCSMPQQILRRSVQMCRSGRRRTKPTRNGISRRIAKATTPYVLPLIRASS